MVLLSVHHAQSLLNAVPSFEEPWRRRTAEREDYERRFPEARLTEEERSDDFLHYLASHLGERVARGELHEVEWLAEALQRIFESLSDDTAMELTVGFLESLVIHIEGAGGDAAVLTPLMRGSLVGWRWRQAYNYQCRLSASRAP